MMEIWLRNTAGSWKVSDLPPPVGRISNTSCPESREDMAVSCSGLKVS